MLLLVEVVVRSVLKGEKWYEFILYEWLSKGDIESLVLFVMF